MKNQAKKTVSKYAINVLATNKSLKDELKSFGAARSVLLTFAKSINLPTEYAKLLRESKENEALYKVLNEETRRSKAGNVSPFFILQMLHKVTEGKNKAFEAYKVESSVKVATGNEIAA